MLQDDGVSRAYARTTARAPTNGVLDGRLPRTNEASQEEALADAQRSVGVGNGPGVAQVVYLVVQRLVGTLEEFLERHVSQVSRIGFYRRPASADRDPSRESLERMCALAVRALTVVVRNSEAPSPERFQSRLLALRLLSQVEGFYRLSFPNRNSPEEALDLPGSPELTVAAINLKALLLGTQIALEAEAAGVSVEPGDVSGES